MLFVVFLSANGQQFWDAVALMGNNHNMYFISPAEEITAGNGAFGVMVRGNTVAVVLDMSKEERESLQKALIHSFLFVVQVSEDDLARWMVGSKVRMENFLKGSSFELPLPNQFHLVQPLCVHAGITSDVLPGVVSIANAKLAMKHGLCYMLWGATSALGAITNMLLPR